MQKFRYKMDMQFSSDVDIPSNSSRGRIAAFGIIDEELGLVREMIAKQLSDVDEFVGKLLDTFGSDSGKMLRPGLVLLSGAACGKITDDHIRVATILEMIHNATLVHDDVIDEGQQRRNSSTVNRIWGNESAVLLGDFLLSRVFKMCADLRPNIIKIIADAASRTCEGELRQTVQTQNWRLSESEYIEIISNKTAALFKSSCRLGALLANAGDIEVRALSDFGFNTGIAFQIIDDLSDIIGDERRAGKTLGTDVNKRKPTLAVIHLLRQADGEKRDVVIEKLNAANEGNKDLVDMLGSCGSIKYAHNSAMDFVAGAIGSLADLKQSNAKAALIETAEFVVSRHFLK